MVFVKLIYDNGRFSYKTGTDKGLGILSDFLSTDVKECQDLFYQEWALDERFDGSAGNFTVLEKSDGHIILTDIFSKEAKPTKLKISIKQFIQILNDWDQKVARAHPKEVIIKHEDGQFLIETKD